MATYTSNYAWTKPGGNDQVDIGVLNNNLDSQDAIMHDAFLNMAEPFSALSTYAVGDIVVYGTKTYKCRVAVTTAGSWTGATNWDEYKFGNEYPSKNVSYGNGSVEDALDEVNERISKHDYTGQFVDISSYTDVNNPYIVPTDGYARVGAGSLRIGTATANVGLATMGETQWTSMFVRKGTPLYVVPGGFATSTKAYFISLA